MKKNHIKTLLVLSVFVIFCSSCASKPKNHERGDFCGIVIDENNSPVPNYLVSCKKEKGLWKTTITDQRGIFMFSDEGFGKYELSGEKLNFQILREENLLFYDKTKIYCFQINSASAMADEIENKLLCSDFEGAIAAMENLKLSQDSPVQKLFQEYKKYMEEKSSDKEEEYEI